MPDFPTTIDLERGSNLRDLGGYVAQDGRRVRQGLVFRAPALVNLPQADLDRIGRLNLRTVVDFRGTKESDRSPVNLPGTTRMAHPIEPSVGASLGDIVLTGQAEGHVTPQDMLDLLTEAYRAYAVVSFPCYRALFALILETDRLPILFHCSAGKDRTGFGAALLLTALGVSWDQVLADYQATDRFWRREGTRNFAMPEPVKEVLLRTHETLLVAAFEAARGAYGSIDAYLKEAVGLDGAARNALAGRLLTP